MKVEIWNPHDPWLPVYRFAAPPGLRRGSLARTRPVVTVRNAILDQLVTLRSSR